jgi:hypothetical protein
MQKNYKAWYKKHYGEPLEERMKRLEALKNRSEKLSVKYNPNMPINGFRIKTKELLNHQLLDMQYYINELNMAGRLRNSNKNKK